MPFNIDWSKFAAQNGVPITVGLFFLVAVLMILVVWLQNRNAGVKVDVMTRREVLDAWGDERGERQLLQTQLNTMDVRLNTVITENTTLRQENAQKDLLLKQKDDQITERDLKLAQRDKRITTLETDLQSLSHKFDDLQNQFNLLAHPPQA